MIQGIKQIYLACSYSQVQALLELGSCSEDVICPLGHLWRRSDYVIVVFLGGSSYAAFVSISTRGEELLVTIGDTCHHTCYLLNIGQHACELFYLIKHSPFIFNICGFVKAQHLNSSVFMQLKLLIIVLCRLYTIAN